MARAESVMVDSGFPVNALNPDKPAYFVNYILVHLCTAETDE